MNKCKKCGTVVPDDAKFCGSCGAKTSSSTETSQSGGSDKTLFWVLIGLIVAVAVALVLFFFVFDGMSLFEKEAEEPAVTTTTTTTTEDEGVNPVRPDRSETTAVASSTLEDDTGIGFDYAPEMALDQDFSTSWVEGAEGTGVGQWIQLNFPSTAKINTLGIVPGYARDESIYGDNNRVKEFEIEFSDGTTVNKTLEDKYGMHFVTFPIIETDSLKVTIKSVYEGTDYEDTPIAELDIWSDYVLNKDSAAALDYYLEYKEPSALYPPSDYILSARMTNDITETLAPADSVTTFSQGAESIIASAQLKLDTPSGKTFTCKWYKGDELLFTDEITSYTEAYNSGKMYIASLLTPEAMQKLVFDTGEYKVNWLVDGKWAKTVTFKVE